MNNGGARRAALSGLPDGIEEFRIYRTDQNHGMQQGEKVRVENGRAAFELDAACYLTLVSGS